MNALPFQFGKWYKLGEVRRFAAELLRIRQEDQAFSAAMRDQREEWMEGIAELYPLKVFAGARHALNARCPPWAIRVVLGTVVGCPFLPR